MEPHPSLSIADEGLTVLEGAVEGPTAVDYVFLHGLNGNPKRTWTYESGEGGFFWPAQILTDIPGCRVMMFGYNALFERALVENTTTINAIAQTFVSRLIDKRKDAAQLNRPLVFIAHSLGGLVVKRAIANIHAESNSGLQTRRVKEQKAIYDSIAGIVFMGTPHFGSNVAKTRIQVLKAIGKATFMNAPEKLLKALSARSNELQDLSTNFEKTTIFTRHEIEMCTYYETKTTRFAGKEEVVPRSMAVLHYLNEREEPIAAEHADMTKFRNEQDDTFQSIRQRIQDMAHDGLDALEARQVGTLATYRISQIPNDVSREQLPYFLLSCRELQIQSVQEIRIHSLAALSGQAQSTKTATATFEEVPRLLRSRSSQWSLSFCHNSSYGTLVIDTHFDGFTVLNDVPEDSHSLDFIAIPGLGHHPFSIWQHDPASDPFMWLRDSLPPLARGTRVLLYGYDARAHRGNPATVEGLVISLISQLRVIDRASLAAKPVVVVAHALAGVVLKQALIELANSGQTEMFILKTVRSCLFLGVPNSYPGKEILASMVGNSRFKHLLAELDTKPNYMAKLDRMMSGIAQSQNISICSGYDTIPDGVLEPADRSSTGRSISPRNCSVNKPDHDILRLPAGSQKIATVAAHLLSQFSPQITGQDPSPVLSRLTTWHLFLDALDEYEGRPEVIVDFIQCSVRSRSGAKTRLKACFSSREWSTFENTFSDCPGLRIHEHTEQDIRTYLSARLSNIYESGSLGVYDKATLCDIEENIATRAQGVFIWVRAITGILRQDYLQGVSILQLSKNAESFPEDLGEFYTDAIRRIPSEYREESFVMFEVILRCEHQLLIEELIATVQCATRNNIPSYIEAMHSHELDQNLLQWVQDRGAGLVEEVRDKTTGLKIVQFIHQSVLDFVAQPGFRSLILQQPLSLPLDNGYTWLSKRAYSYLQMGYLTSSAKYISGRANYLSRAEATTGRSMKAFWDDVEEDAIDGFLGSQGWPTTDIHDPKLAFAVIYNLTTLLQDIIHSRNGVLSDTGPFSLLHCLTYIDVFGATPNHIKRKEIDLRGHSVDKASGDVVAILVRHGTRLDAKYQGYTPFQLLFEEFNYHRFTGSSGPQNTRPAILELVHQFLKAGQEPNVVLVKRRKISRTPSERVLCSPLHVARPDLAILILQFGAKTNIMDSRGLTPLDLSCGVGENVHEIGDHVSPVGAYETAALLLRQGAKLTKAGWKKWPEFVHLLEARGGISIPDSFNRPPRMTVSRLVLVKHRLALWALKRNS